MNNFTDEQLVFLKGLNADRYENEINKQEMQSQLKKEIGCHCQSAKRNMKLSEWISVKDRLPPRGVNSLLYAPKVPNGYSRRDGDIFVGYWHGEIDFDMDRRYWECVWGDNWVPYEWENVTHWMPLPSPPKNNGK